MPPLTDISTIESHFWEAANILRGSPVDRTDWKSYILPLLFFKRICDVWDEEFEEAVETYGEDFADEHRFQLPEGCRWNDVRETAANVTTMVTINFSYRGNKEWRTLGLIPYPILILICEII
jgi:type I restriction enzyme M protein